MAKRKIYSDEFKAKACKLVTEGKLTHKAAGKKVGGVSAIVIGRWLAKAKAAPKKPAPKKAVATKIPQHIVAGGTLGIEIQAKIDQLEEDLAALNKVKDLLRK